MVQIVEFVGNDPDAGKLFTLGSDVVVATAASVAPATNRKSIFAATFSGVSVGEYQFIAFDGTEADAIWTVAITAADGVFTAYERSVNTSAGASNGTVTRSLTDTEPIQFAWPVTGATLTGEVDFNSSNDYQAVLGTFAFLYTEGGVHYYTLAHNAADRPAEEGAARYKVTDGVRTKWFNLRTAAGSDVSSEQIAAIPAAILGYDWTTFVGDPPSRSVLNALRHIRNKWIIAGLTKSVMKEDDTTVAYTTTIVADANGNITEDTPD